MLIPIFMWGVGISPDSVAYLSTANNLCDGKGFTMYDNTYTTNWPWLFPIFLAFIKLALGNILLVIGIINLLLLIGTFHFTQKQLKQPSTKILLLILFCSPPFIKLGIMLWSESLFMALLIPSFIAITQKQNPKRINYVLLSLAGITRYAYFPIAVGAIILEVIQQKRITQKATLLCSTLLPLLVNLGYNSIYQVKIVNQNLAGNQLTRAWTNITQNSSTLILTTLFISTIGYLLYTSKTNTSKQILASIIGYFCLVISFDNLQDAEIVRYLLPILPFIIWLIDIEISLNNYMHKMLMWCLGLTNLITCIYVWQISKNGTGGYNTKKWETSSVEQVVNWYPKDKLLWSNSPDFIYYRTHHSCKMITPSSTIDTSSTIIWIDEVKRTIVLPPELKLQLIRKTNDISEYKLP